MSIENQNQIITEMPTFNGGSNPEDGRPQFIDPATEARVSGPEDEVNQAPVRIQVVNPYGMESAPVQKAAESMPAQPGRRAKPSAVAEEYVPSDEERPTSMEEIRRAVAQIYAEDEAKNASHTAN